MNELKIRRLRTLYILPSAAMLCTHQTTLTCLDVRSDSRDKAETTLEVCVGTIMLYWPVLQSELWQRKYVGTNDPALAYFQHRPIHQWRQKDGVGVVHSNA